MERQLFKSSPNEGAATDNETSEDTNDSGHLWRRLLASLSSLQRRYLPLTRLQLLSQHLSSYFIIQDNVETQSASRSTAYDCEISPEANADDSDDIPNGYNSIEYDYQGTPANNDDTGDEDLSDDHEDSWDDYEEFRAGYEVLRADYENSWGDYEEFRVDYEALTAEFEELRTEFEELRADHEERRTDYEERRPCHRVYYEDHRAVYEDLRAVYEDIRADYEDRWDAFEDRWAAFEDRLGDYENRWGDYEYRWNYYERLRDDYEELREDYEELWDDYDLWDDYEEITDDYEEHTDFSADYEDGIFPFEEFPHAHEANSIHSEDVNGGIGADDIADNMDVIPVVVGSFHPAISSESEVNIGDDIEEGESGSINLEEENVNSNFGIGHNASRLPNGEIESDVVQGVKRKAEVTQEGPSSKIVRRTFECPVCKMDLEGKKVVAPSCGHIMCHTCMQRNLNFQKKCPICRDKIRPCSVRNIYL